MRKYDYFIGSLRDNADYAREWILRAMAVVIDQPLKDTPWALRHTEKAVEVYVPAGQEGWKWEVLEGVKPYEIPFIYHDATGPIPKGAIENLDRPLGDSTWGDLLFNHRTLCYACGSIIPFQEGPVDLKAVEKIFADNMVDDVWAGSRSDVGMRPDLDVPGQLYVKHWVRFGKAIGDLAGYEMFVPSVTERALQAPADNKKLRDELLAKNAGQLDDPVRQSEIQNELVKNYVDKQLKGDPSEGFIYSKKSLNTAIKRMFLIHGPEAGFSEGGRATLVINSLEEGLDIKQYPAMVNSLRAGSYYRGALTALAGEDVDLMGRIFQNARIVPGFCGTTETYTQLINSNYMGRTLLVDNQQVKVTKENFDQFKGQVHEMFSPLRCKAGHNDTCEVCMGAKISAYPDSTGSMVADVPSKMMQVMMGSAHAKELKTTPLDVANFLR